MWRTEYAKLLKNEIEEQISNLNKATDLRDLVREPLTKTGRGLNSEIEEERPWPLLPVVVSEVISGFGERALPAAASLQFLLSAGDVFDDIEDSDSADSICTRYGLAVATNAASTLLILGEGSLVRLKFRGVSPEAIVRVIEVVNSFYTTACAGQHLDLTAETPLTEAEENYLNVISMKSAAQIECACSIGAIVAGASQELIDAFALFGRNLGMASQIGNDIQGIVSGKDIRKRKITLPVIYALNLPDNGIHYELSQVFLQRNSPIVNVEAIKTRLFQTGAVYYATIKMDIYKQKASDILTDIQSRGINVEMLKLFLT
jgi:geranylgeranyl pyrophosphate synthase